MARLKWKTAKGDVEIGIPTALDFVIPQFGNRVWYPTYDDYINAAKLNVKVDMTTGSYVLYYPPSHVNSVTLARAAQFELVDIFDVEYFDEPWECNDARVNWKLTTDSSGNILARGTLRVPSGSSYLETTFMTFYVVRASANIASEVTLNYSLAYYPETNSFITLGTDAPGNNLRVKNDNNQAYQLYQWGRHTISDANSISISNALLYNTSGGGGGFIPTPEPPTPPSDDPYSPGGYSGGGGGPAGTGGTGTTGTGGLHDDTSDAIPTPSLPPDVTISSGLFTAYNPSASQLASFASALWNMQPEDINDVLRFLFGGDAFNAVIGLHLLPVAPSTGGTPSIKLGNWDTGVSAPKITSQYVQASFGSVLLPEYWGNCIDYSPYTKIQLALPYIGIVDVDTDDVLGSNNTLTYNIDVLSGAICATLKCEKFNLNSVIYQWSGACAVSLPFSGASYNSVLSAIAGVAAAGMGFASMAAGPIGAALPAAALAAGAGAFGAGSAASIMGTMKGKVQKSGSFGANSGALGIMTPYFILTRPVQSVPETWQADKGYPSNISAQLGTLSGYTEVSEINLECSGTEAEKKEIIDLLKKGVLF